MFSSQIIKNIYFELLLDSEICNSCVTTFDCEFQKIIDYLSLYYLEYILNLVIIAVRGGFDRTKLPSFIRSFGNLWNAISH